MKDGQFTVLAEIGRANAPRWEQTKEGVVDMKNTQTDGTEVSYASGLTINLGNYESLRIDVGVKLPSTVENMPADLEHAKNFVHQKLMTETAEARKNI